MHLILKRKGKSLLDLKNTSYNHGILLLIGKLGLLCNSKKDKDK